MIAASIMDQKTNARRGLAVFFVFLIASSVIPALPFFSRMLGNHVISIYMWCVGCASLAARLAMRESLRDVSFRWFGATSTRAMIVATAFPLATAAVAYGIGWSMGLAHLSVSGVPERAFGFSLGGNGVLSIGKYLLLSMTAGALWNCKSAAGEEIGWRGYMLLRLKSAGFPKPILLSGLIWGVWHLPLILTREYTPVPVSILPIVLFIANVTAAGYVFAWLRWSSGSIWPCIWAHGLWNALILGPFAGLNSGGGLWVGEGGLLTMAVCSLFAWVLFTFCPIEIPASVATQPGTGRSTGRRVEHEPQA
jgi:membrane protease YdiL (CAAX protease family)